MECLDLFAVNDSKSPVSEAFRILRTNIQFSSVDMNIKTVLVTSSCPGEGKSTISANLSIINSEDNKKTLLIDCDLRAPKIYKMFRLSNLQGLSNVLIGESDLKTAIQKTDINNLYILPSGTIPQNPAGLLGSQKMKQLLIDLACQFDFIILDTPPIAVVTDAQLLAPIVDGCILVAASEQVERDVAIKAKHLLLNVKAKILGVVLNKVDISQKSYYYSYYNDNCR